MVARLVYVVDGREIELEKMSLDALDEFTYSAFGSLEEILDSPRYQDRLEKLSKTGEVKIAYEGFDIPLKSTEYLGEFGFNPFTGTQYMSVLVGDRKIGPTVRSLKETIFKSLSSVEAVEEFYQTFKDKYTPYERLMYHAGMLYENNRLVAEGIKRIVDDATCHSDGYFTGRVFLDELGKFSSIKNKDEKGNVISPKKYEKK